MSLSPGNYRGTIVSHGLDTYNGTPLMFFNVTIRNPNTGYDEDVRIRFNLASTAQDPAEKAKKTATALRMARQILKVCGFDPDVRPLSDLEDVEDLLRGVEVPVSVRQNGQYTNYDIILPRGVTKGAAADLTSQLRAAKANEEPPVATRPQRSASGATQGSVPVDDIPF